MLTQFTTTATRTFALLIAMTGMILLSGCNASNPINGSGTDSYETSDGSGDDLNLDQSPIPSLERPIVEEPQPNAVTFQGSIGVDRGTDPNEGSGLKDGSGDDNIVENPSAVSTAGRSNAGTSQGSVDTNQGSVLDDGSGDG